MKISWSFIDSDMIYFATYDPKVLESLALAETIPTSGLGYPVIATEAGALETTVDTVITGTLSLPGEAIDMSYTVMISDILSIENPLITVNGICGSGTSVEFTLDAVYGGTYYLIALVDTDSSGELSDGDYIGIYGGSLSELPVMPNAEVPESGTVDLDLTLEIY
jgi:hypothetical protein